MRRLGGCCGAPAAGTSRRTFMKTAALGAAGLPLLAARGTSQTSSRKYRVCEIGHDGDYGHMGGAFAGFPNVTMVAVADPVEKARLQHAARVNAPRAYADFREMLQKEKPDVVGIGPNRKTYSAQRFEMIKAAAEHGAHVMVDKPHARSLDEADQIIALAEKHKIKSVVYHPRAGRPRGRASEEARGRRPHRRPRGGAGLGGRAPPAHGLALRLRPEAFRGRAPLVFGARDSKG